MKNLVRTGLSLLALAALPSVSQALTFNFIPAPGTSAAAVNGFIAAGARWSAIFDDPVQINIEIGFSVLSSGALGETEATVLGGNFSLYKSFMNNDQTSAADVSAVASLPGGLSMGALMNYTTENGGVATAYLDNDGTYNNRFFVTSSAELKALGALPPTTGVDGKIQFSSAYSFDFDPSNGITGGMYDFVGMATHELGHAMGFFSGVDSRDYVTFNYGVQFENTAQLEMTPMDFFRFSSPGTRDWTLGTANKYFSIDDGVTAIAPFATGVSYGDGRQASHWKDNLSIGIMDPTVATGELLAISPSDVLMMDVLGWDLTGSTPVPEAGTIWAGLTFASLGWLEVRRRRGAKI